MPGVPVPISQLNGATLPLTGAELAVVVQDGVSKMVEIANWVPPSAGVEDTLSASGTVNNLDLAGVGRLLIDTSGGDLTITGIVAGYDGEIKYISNTAANSVFLSREDVGSTTINRLWGVDTMVIPERGTIQ